MIITGTVNSSWVRADIREFSIPTRNPGTGSDIIGPIATYIRGINMATEVIRRLCISFWFSSVISLRFCHSFPNPLSFWASVPVPDAP